MFNVSPLVLAALRRVAAVPHRESCPRSLGCNCHRRDVKEALDEIAAETSSGVHLCLTASSSKTDDIVLMLESAIEQIRTGETELEEDDSYGQIKLAITGDEDPVSSGEDQEPL